MTGIVGGLAATGAIDLSGFVSEIVAGTAPAFYTMETTGVITHANGGGTWLLNGASSNYEVFATVTVGTLSSGTTGSWIDFSTDRTWQKNVGSCTFTLELRDKWTTTTIKTVTIELVT